MPCGQPTPGWPYDHQGIGSPQSKSNFLVNERLNLPCVQPTPNRPSRVWPLAGCRVRVHGRVRIYLILVAPWTPRTPQLLCPWLRQCFFLSSQLPLPLPSLLSLLPSFDLPPEFPVPLSRSLFTKFTFHQGRIWATKTELHFLFLSCMFVATL